MAKIVVSWLAALVVLAGCAYPPTRTDGRPLTQQNAGPRPDRNAVIVAYLNDVLKDPESARISNISGPTFINVESELLVRGTYGWGICFMVNAKNSFGGYTGARMFTLIWRDGQVVRVYGDQRDNMFDRARAINMCAEIQQGAARAAQTDTPVHWPKPPANLFEGQQPPIKY